ncbi:MAG: sodium:calcium antiporter [Candidatus Bathyarchaeota archaeon]|nr:sodium:calcium antiporter [Candidatus Bathyarchaeota archaeon]
MFEEQLGLWGNVFLLVISLVVLAKASDYAINSSIKVADITGLAKSTVGFVLVGFSTSLPELFVVIFAAAGQGSVGVAIGNVLGSNIANIALILGICFLILTFKMPRHEGTYPQAIKEKIHDLYFGLFVASLVPLALLYFGYASSLMGVLLLGVFVLNMYQLSKGSKKQCDPEVTEECPVTEEEIPERSSLKRYLLIALAASICVVIASYFLVGSATYVATSVGIPGVVIGATIVAFGTSAPELATSISATRKGHIDLAMGNIVGSCFINITLILGATLIASPLDLDISAFSQLALFSLITNLFLWYFLSSERLTWREGAMLLGMYALFIATSFL